MAFVSPNPTMGNVAVSANVEDGEVVVFDMFGKEVATAKVSEYHANLDLSDYASGVYMVRITGGSGMTTVRIVKQ